MAIPNPHDAFVKGLLEDTELAADLFRGALPPDVSAVLNLNSIRQIPATFIDEELRETRGDALFEVQTTDGQPLQIWILFEHKSKADPKIFKQLLGYLTRVYEQQEIPVPVLPFVLYHGDQPWPYPHSFTEAFRMPEALRPYALNFRYVLLDLAATDPVRLRMGLTMLLAMFTLQHSRSRPFDPDLWEPVLRETRAIFAEPSATRAIERIFSYLSVVFETSDFQKLNTSVDRVAGPEAKEQVMKAAEYFKLEGEIKGKQEGKLDNARRMLEREVSLTDILDYTGLSEGDLREAGLIQ